MVSLDLQMFGGRGGGSGKNGSAGGISAERQGGKFAESLSDSALKKYLDEQWNMFQGSGTMYYKEYQELIEKGEYAQAERLAQELADDAYIIYTKDGRYYYMREVEDYAKYRREIRKKDVAYIGYSGSDGISDSMGLGYGKHAEGTKGFEQFVHNPAFREGYESWVDKRFGKKSGR